MSLSPVGVGYLSTKKPSACGADLAAVADRDRMPARRHPAVQRQRQRLVFPHQGAVSAAAAWRGHIDERGRGDLEREGIEHQRGHRGRGPRARCGPCRWWSAPIRVRAGCGARSGAGRRSWAAGPAWWRTKRAFRRKPPREPLRRENHGRPAAKAQGNFHPARFPGRRDKSTAGRSRNRFATGTAQRGRCPAMPSQSAHWTPDREFPEPPLAAFKGGAGVRARAGAAAGGRGALALPYVLRELINRRLNAVPELRRAGRRGRGQPVPWRLPPARDADRETQRRGEGGAVLPLAQDIDFSTWPGGSCCMARSSATPSIWITRC